MIGDRLVVPVARPGHGHGQLESQYVGLGKIAERKRSNLLQMLHLMFHLYLENMT